MNLSEQSKYSSPTHLSSMSTFKQNSYLVLPNSATVDVVVREGVLTWMVSLLYWNDCQKSALPDLEDVWPWASRKARKKVLKRTEGIQCLVTATNLFAELNNFLQIFVWRFEVKWRLSVKKEIAIFNQQILQLPVLRRNHAGFQLAHPKLRQDTIPFSVLLYIGKPYWS